MTAAMTAMTALLAATTKKAPSSSSSTFLIFIVLIAVVGYFLLIRPQRQKQRRQREQQSAVSVGDEILTVGGIVGRVIAVDADRVTVLSGGDTVGFPAVGNEPTRLVLVRNAIARKLDPQPPSDADAGEVSGNGTAEAAGSNGASYDGHFETDEVASGTELSGAEDAESEGTPS